MKRFKRLSRTSVRLLGAVALISIVAVGCERPVQPHEHNEPTSPQPDSTIVKSNPSELVVRASVTPTIGTRPLRVSCTGSATGGSGKSIYEWDFGQGVEGFGANVAHTFNEIGNHIVTVTAIDTLGIKATKLLNVVVKGNTPRARISSGNLAGDAPLIVQFDGSASTDSDDDIETYRWEFGDGSAADGRAASHTYSVPGTYRVKLIVTDETGLTSTANVTANITRFSPPILRATVRATTNASVSVRIPPDAGGEWLITATGSAAFDATGGDARWHGPDGFEGRGQRRGCTIGALGASYEGATLCIGSGSRQRLVGGSTISFWFADDKYGDNAGSYQVTLNWVSR